MADQAAVHSASSDQPLNSTASPACFHLRLIDDVMSADGQRTGKVRCVECGAIFDGEIPAEDPA
ncbi:MAG TPA: hypothetical protein VJR03_10240 [Nitrospira sp.]|nr:hypothetical protein [Nitrospira sp.]